MNDRRKRLYLKELPEFEMRLLEALAFFLGRPVGTQASAALAMYMRQSHDRIMAQVDYYASKAGTSRYELLELIHTDPDKARELLDDESLNPIHDGEEDKFTD